MNSPVPVPVDDWSAERGELHGQMVKWLRKDGLIDAICSWPWVTLCVVLGAIASTLRFVTEYAAPAARADAAMEELLTEEQAERAKGPAPSKSSKKQKQKAPSVAAPAPPPAAVLKPAASDAKRA